MAEQIQVILEPKDVVALLLKQHKIHSGLWSFTVEFQLSLGLAGASAEAALPTAMASVSRIGIQHGQELNSVTFDAAELNPAPRQRAARKPAEAKIPR